MYILGIESSCDETAVAIYSDKGLLAHQIHSQVDLHAVYGGVVPELASRDHIRKTLPLIQQALCDANLKKSDLGGIAYTRGPGLIGALMVGASIAKSLAYGLDIPALGVHHMESHLMAVFLEDQKPQYPFLALLVSGGHTLLVHIKSLGDYTLLGESVDDAVGEAFDKTAKILGLPYPGGPHLAKLAESGDSNRFHFPRPMLNRPGLNFSFSGLKTHALNTVNKEQCDEQTRADIACAFEEAVVDVLTKKCLRALEQTNVNTLVMVGGVAANKKLRQRLTTTLAQQQQDIFFPRQQFCTDNGAMVAYNGWLRMRAGQCDVDGIEVKTRWSLAELAPP